MSMLICKLWFSCRDAVKLSWFHKAELLQQVTQHAPQTSPLPLRLVSPHMPYIVLLPTSSPHRSRAYKPHAGVWMPPHSPSSCSFHSPCAFPKEMSAPSVFSCTKSTSAPANIPVSEQTCASTFLFSNRWVNHASLWPPFSQEGAPSVMKWDSIWDRRYCLFLS